MQNLQLKMETIKKNTTKNNDGKQKIVVQLN